MPGYKTVIKWRTFYNNWHADTIPTRLSPPIWLPGKAGVSKETPLQACTKQYRHDLAQRQRHWSTSCGWSPKQAGCSKGMGPLGTVSLPVCHQFWWSVCSAYFRGARNIPVPPFQKHQEPQTENWLTSQRAEKALTQLLKIPTMYSTTPTIPFPQQEN